MLRDGGSGNHRHEAGRIGARSASTTFTARNRAGRLGSEARLSGPGSASGRRSKGRPAGPSRAGRPWTRRNPRAGSARRWPRAIGSLSSAISNESSCSPRPSARGRTPAAGACVSVKDGRQFTDPVGVPPGRSVPRMWGLAVGNRGASHRELVDWSPQFVKCTHSPNRAKASKYRESPGSRPIETGRPGPRGLIGMLCAHARAGPSRRPRDRGRPFPEGRQPAAGRR